METRTFCFRLQSEPDGAADPAANLQLEFLNDHQQWEPQQLQLTTPGFRLSLISLLLCQHHYLVANAREVALSLERVTAEFTVTMSIDWIIRSVEGDFLARLALGAEATTETLCHIEERMRLCPVSRNLPDAVDKHITFSLIDS